MSLFHFHYNNDHYNVMITRSALNPGQNSPVLDQWDVKSSPGPARPQVEGSWGPQQGNAIGCVISVERSILQERFHKLWQLKLFIVIRQWFLALKYRSTIQDVSWLLQLSFLS